MSSFNCPECLASINYKESMAGKVAECPSCSKPVRVPGAVPVNGGPPGIPETKAKPQLSRKPEKRDGRKKSPALAVALALLLGPMGMLYVTVSGAVTMFVVFVVLSIAVDPFIAALIVLPLCVIWSSMAAHAINGDSVPLTNWQKSIKAVPKGLDLIGGGIGASIYLVLFFDTTVPVPGTIDNRVYNSGLLNEQIVGVILSCTLILCGVIRYSASLIEAAIRPNNS